MSGRPSILVTRPVPGDALDLLRAEADVEVRPLRTAPPREELYASCDRRFDLMMDCGALDEVRALDGQGLPEDAPILKALGVPELRGLLHGRMDRAEAIRWLGRLLAQIPDDPPLQQRLQALVAPGPQS